MKYAKYFRAESKKWPRKISCSSGSASCESHAVTVCWDKTIYCKILLKALARCGRRSWRTLIIPMTRENLENFLGDMAADQVDGKVKAAATVDGYCTVLKYYYRAAGFFIDAELANFFKNFHEGYKRIVARKKEAGIMKNYEGKVAVTYVIYCALAKVALFAASERTQFSSFVHLYLVLCWNLFSRSCSVSSLRTHHCKWVNDSLVIDMSVQKGDQTGENIKPKHVYANPYNPELCPILALALHTFAVSCRPGENDKSRIFIGTPYDVFG